MAVINPHLDSMSLSPEERQINIERQLSGAPLLGTEELSARRAIGADEARSAEQRGLIDQFFQDPARQEEIDRIVNAGLNQAFAGLEQRLRQRSRQNAFDLARSGNVGGSVQAGRQAALTQQAALQGADISAQASAQEEGLQRALEAQRVQELLQTFNLDPFLQAGVQQRLGQLGIRSEGLAATTALQDRADQLARFNDDEFSRVLGNFLNIPGTAFQTDQLAKAEGKRGLF